ncbi:SDR family oxidoreductase [Halalkalibacter urbisdiaboli]|uniref:SDR family oxidoreductase n=1 Tax=Halalkalibacter urbisdiaboli TaxID=1960589 RepID=UPI000B4543FA|nr:SDR family oxidoreductase [Halalkalibacter urbisdiaboli]
MRHVFLTAGTKGLGVKVVEAFLQRGYSVTVTYRSDEKNIQELEKRWSHFAQNLQFIKADVTNKEQIQQAVNRTIERFGKIDILINNAGPYVFERKKLLDYDEDEWYRMIEGNLSAVYHLLKQVVPHMRKQRFGRIVTYGFQGANSAPGWIYRSAYAAAKVGLVSLMKTISIEEAEYGITANMICPGNILGEMKEATIAEARMLPDGETPIGRSGTGEDIARTVLFLCEDDADMVTGTVVEVTGGVDVIHRYR